jgi:hypothetical protein
MSIVKLGKRKDEFVAQLGLTILEKMARSPQARAHISTIPISILATFLKNILHFLIFFRLVTGNSIVDFFISIFLSIFTALLSPLFLVAIKDVEPHLVKFTNHFMDRAMMKNNQGVEYLLTVRNRGVLATSTLTILFLLYVDVDSHYLIRSIIEYLICFWVVDQVVQVRDSFYLPVEVVVRSEFHASPTQLQITKYDYFKPPKRVLRASAYLHTHALIPSVSYPKRAIRVNIKPANKFKDEKIAGKNRRIIEDWGRGHYAP